MLWMHATLQRLSQACWLLAACQRILEWLVRRISALRHTPLGPCGMLPAMLPRCAGSIPTKQWPQTMWTTCLVQKPYG